MGAVLDWSLVLPFRRRMVSLLASPARHLRLPALHQHEMAREAGEDQIRERLVVGVRGKVAVVRHPLAR